MGGDDMSDAIFLERFQTYIDCHSRALKPSAPPTTRKQLPAVTISRETGTGGIAFAERLAVHLQAHAPRTGCPWTVFHKNLVERVLADHNLPKRLAQFIVEDKVPAVADAVEELLGMHPPIAHLVRQTAETILRLAELGHVILVGRGANVVTARLGNVFHVRLVGSFENRANRYMEVHHVSREAALVCIEKEDAGRQRYVKRYFGKEIADPLLYHAVVNTDLVTLDEAAQLIGETVVRKYY
jgi:hypothetical protein